MLQFINRGVAGANLVGMFVNRGVAGANLVGMFINRDLAGANLTAIFVNRGVVGANHVVLYVKHVMVGENLVAIMYDQSLAGFCNCKSCRICKPLFIKSSPCCNMCAKPAVASVNLVAKPNGYL